MLDHRKKVKQTVRYKSKFLLSLANRIIRQKHSNIALWALKRDVRLWILDLVKAAQGL